MSRIPFGGRAWRGGSLAAILLLVQAGVATGSDPAPAAECAAPELRATLEQTYARHLSDWRAVRATLGLSELPRATREAVRARTGRGDVEGAIALLHREKSLRRRDADQLASEVMRRGLELAALQKACGEDERLDATLRELASLGSERPEELRLLARAQRLGGRDAAALEALERALERARGRAETAGEGASGAGSALEAELEAERDALRRQLDAPPPAPGPSGAPEGASRGGGS